jgi:hypothetical protein
MLNQKSYTNINLFEERVRLLLQLFNFFFFFFLKKKKNMTIDQQLYSNELKTEKLNSEDVGLIFAREYYTFLNKKPNRLHAFYGADSLLVRGDEGETVPMLKGQEVT